MRKIFGTLAVLLVSGCTTPYVQPEGPNTATLTILNTAAQGAVNTLTFKVARDCSGGKQTLPGGDRLGINQKTSIRVKGDEDFSFSVHYLYANRYCHMPATFHPQAGRAYLARFSAGDLMCFLAIQVETPAGPIKEPSFKLRKWHTPMWEDGSFCTD